MWSLFIHHRVMHWVALFTVSIEMATVNLPAIAGFTMAAFLLSGREKIGVNHDGIY